MSERVDYWDAQAPAFDDAADHGLRDPSVRAAWNSLLVSLLPPAPAHVVDLGCGTGSVSVLLSSNGHLLTGVDFASRMIQRARDKAAEAKLDVRFIVGDVSHPGLPDESFDVVLSRHVLWAMDDPNRALENWIRILRPYGRLVLIEGQWSTGAGIPAASLVDMLRAQGRAATITSLKDPRLWGEAISDERYVVVSQS